jgi:hypothetical protein
VNEIFEIEGHDSAETRLLVGTMASTDRIASPGIALTRGGQLCLQSRPRPTQLSRARRET